MPCIIASDDFEQQLLSLCILYATLKGNIFPLSALSPAMRLEGTKNRYVSFSQKKDYFFGRGFFLRAKIGEKISKKIRMPVYW